MPSLPAQAPLVSETAPVAEFSTSPTSVVYQEVVQKKAITYSTSTAYYDLYGLTEGELRAEMNEKGLLNSDGKRYDAFTSCYYTWRYFSVWDGKYCYVDTVRVETEIKVTFPRWVWFENASEPLRSKWAQYTKLLMIHENGHVSINSFGAQDLYHRLMDIGPRKSCEELDLTLRETASMFYNDIKIQNERYDAETMHGRSHGAVFP